MAFNERVFLKVINLVPPESLVVVIVVVIVVVVAADVVADVVVVVVRQKLRLCPSAPSQKRGVKKKPSDRILTCRP